MKSEEEWKLNYEKKQIETELERQQREAEERRAKIELDKKNHQKDVLKQIGERDRNQRRELQEKMYEERAAKLAEIGYVKKIDTQKDFNKNLI